MVCHSVINNLLIVNLLIQIYSGASVTESLDWALLNPSLLSPHGSMVALHTKSDGAIHFTTGSLAGENWSVSKMRMQKRSDWSFIQPIILAYATILVDSGRKVRGHTIPLHHSSTADKYAQFLVHPK